MAVLQRSGVSNRTPCSAQDLSTKQEMQQAGRMACVPCLDQRATQRKGLVRRLALSLAADEWVWVEVTSTYFPSLHLGPISYHE